MIAYYRKIMDNQKFYVPADVPAAMQDIFAKNYAAITKNTDKLFLFSCDHKIEHLFDDFIGPNIPKEVMHTEHLFAIAQQGTIGAMATQLGLIARYGKKFNDINYIVKLNSKTNLIKSTERDPYSAPLWHIPHVVEFKEQSGLPICGIGLTIYLGS